MQRFSSSSLSMLVGPSAGFTATISVVGLATARAAAPIATVIDAVVLGLTIKRSTDSG